MKAYHIILTGLVGLLVGAGIFFWLRMSSLPAAPAAQSPVAKASGTASPEGAEAKIQYPVDSGGGASSDKAAPDSADVKGQSLEDALTGYFGVDAFAAVFNLEDVARKFVFTVDTCTSKAQAPPERSLLQALDSEFRTVGQGDDLAIAPENSARYKALMELVRSADPARLTAIYAHFYPQIQAAYDELGSGRYFNDRLVEVIDHILKAPEPQDAPKLVLPGPHFKYKYAEEDLEGRSAAQKVLVRMGLDNERIIKDKLRQIRRLLVRLGIRT